MNNFEFCNPVKVVFGKGSIARLSALIPEGSKVLVVYGGGSIKKNGIYEQVTAALKDFHTYEFGGIEANPRYETCMKAVELVKGGEYRFLAGGRRRISDRRYEIYRFGYVFRGRSLGYLIERWRNKEGASFRSSADFGRYRFGNE